MQRLIDSSTDLYLSFIVGKCIDFYKQRSQQAYGKHLHDRDDIDLENLKSVVDAVFQKTLGLKQYRKVNLLLTACETRQLVSFIFAFRQLEPLWTCDELTC